MSKCECGSSGGIEGLRRGHRRSKQAGNSRAERNSSRLTAPPALGVELPPISTYAEMRQDRDAACARITQLENATRPH